MRLCTIENGNARNCQFGCIQKQPQQLHGGGCGRVYNQRNKKRKRKKITIVNSYRMLFLSFNGFEPT